LEISKISKSSKSLGIFCTMTRHGMEATCQLTVVEERCVSMVAGTCTCWMMWSHVAYKLGRNDWCEPCGRNWKMTRSVGLDLEVCASREFN
jgi:hypothetical protein